MVEMARFIKPILGHRAARSDRPRPARLGPLAGARPRLRSDCRSCQQAVFVQLMTMSAPDFLDQWFETDPLKATMSASGIIGTFQGVRSPGHGVRPAPPLHGRDRRRVPGLGPARGGTGGVSEAIASAARALGRRDPDRGARRPDRVRGGRAVGVVLEIGEEIGADVVLSSVDARRTFLGLVEPGTLDPTFEAEVRRFKFRGSSGKVNLAVDGLPDFTCLPGEGEHLRGAISFSPPSTTWSGPTTTRSTAT